MNMLDIDTQAINQAIKLFDLIGGLRRNGRYSIGPCPFCEGTDRFNIKHTDYGDLWICRHCGDGKYCDAIAFIMKRDGLTFTEVFSKYSEVQMAESTLTMARPSIPHSGLVIDIDRPPDDDWQIPALVAQYDAAGYLRKSENQDAAAAWDYLRNHRGLSKETLFQANIGYNPTWHEASPGYWLAPGITIPAMIDGELWYVQVRTTKAAREAAENRGRKLDKYRALGGSKLKALFNANSLLTAHTAIVTEGEFDALLLGEFLPEGVAAVTMGSANTLPGVAFLKYFAAVRRVFLVMDNDSAGQAGLERWRNLLGWAERMPPLPGRAKDITDYWKAGGDLAAWVEAAVYKSN
jgi:DNA primase